jgi:transposase
MRPTAYRRNARGLRDRQAFEGVPCRPGHCSPLAAPKPRSPAPSGWPAKTSAAGTLGGKPAGCRRYAAPAPPGLTRGLSDAQLAAIDQALRQGARAHGFDTDHWTLERITTVIERLTGVAYHRGHVWKLLRHRLHYRLLRPARRAIERDERAIARWVAEDWP